MKGADRDGVALLARPAERSRAAGSPNTVTVVVAAVIFTVRRRLSPVKTVILVIGLAVLGYVVKDTFVPIPPAPYNWVALAAGITLVLGIALPFVYPPLRRGIDNSPLLKAGASALLGPGRRELSASAAAMPRR